MAGQKFNHKTFNPEAFASYIGDAIQPNKNELIKSRVLVGDERIKTLLSTQTGSYYATIPYFGRIDGEALNYDGETDITATGMGTFEQSVVAVGRAKAWFEKDFSFEITAGVDFMSKVAEQVSDYWDDIDTLTLMSIIKGIFSMTGDKNLEFVNKHTFDITGEIDNKVTATTLNTAIQQASGDLRNKFSMVFMHSAVATNLENQNLLEYLKYTDEKGIQRALPLATWNGRSVIIDDGMPVDADGNYTTYVFGEGAFAFEELGAKVPYAMTRDEAKNGGETTLYSRRRFCFAPKGISYTKTSQATLSPTNAELANGANWKLIDNGESGDDLKVVDHRQIAIARIISKG